MRLLVAVNMSASGKATQAAVAAEANPGTFRKKSSRKGSLQEQSTQIGCLEHTHTHRRCANAKSLGLRNPRPDQKLGR